MVMMRVQSVLVLLCIFFMLSCEKKGAAVRDEFSSPEKTYSIWIEAGKKGDLVMAMECITEASKRMMDQQARNRDEFMRRMVTSSATFANFSVIDKRASDEKAIIVIESPDKKGRVGIPFFKEADGWKVDLVAMFGG